MVGIKTEGRFPQFHHVINMVNQLPLNSQNYKHHQTNAAFCVKTFYSKQIMTNSSHSSGHWVCEGTPSPLTSNIFTFAITSLTTADFVGFPCQVHIIPIWVVIWDEAWNNFFCKGKSCQLCLHWASHFWRICLAESLPVEVVGNVIDRGLPKFFGGCWLAEMDVDFQVRIVDLSQDPMLRHTSIQQRALG